jgi:hypothetical protein
MLRIACFVLFAAMSVYAAGFSIANFGQAQIRTVASDLTMRRNVSVRRLREAAESLLIDKAVASCRSDFLQDALTVILYNLDQTNQVADYDGWVKAHLRSQKFVHGMVRCLPMDANAWLREAMMSRTIAEDANDLDTKLQVASQLAPFERQQISARLSVWKRLSPHALAICAPLVQGDILSVLRYGMDPMVKALPIGAPDPLHAMITAQLGAIGQDRRAAIDPFLAASQPSM